ncbi:MAG: hypothetical protein ACFE8V_06850 [Promethearchaeota archaeon]
MNRVFNKEELFPLKIQNFVRYLRSLGRSYKLKIGSYTSPYSFTLKQSPSAVVKVLKQINITISEHPEFYTIELSELNSEGNGTPTYEKIYNVKVEGDNNITNILSDIEGMLKKSIRCKLNSKYPF